jgi:hypothetical protein
LKNKNAKPGDSKAFGFAEAFFAGRKVKIFHPSITGKPGSCISFSLSSAIIPPYFING